MSHSRVVAAVEMGTTKVVVLVGEIVDDSELKKYYSESLNWQISREKYFDFSAVYSLRKILKNFNDGSVFHIFSVSFFVFFACLSLIKSLIFAGIYSVFCSFSALELLRIEQGLGHNFQ